jgi:superfamily II DNA/RNA helicase
MAQFLPYIHISYAVRDPVMSKRNSLVRGQLLTEPIVIGTPGTVEEWCYRRRVIDLNKLRMCCVDEADVMIAMEGFQKICVDLVHGLDRSICQMMLFSATYSDEVMTFAREIVDNPLVLRLKREKQALNNIRQFFIRCYDPQQKFYAIEQIYANLTVGQTIVFCRTKAAAHDLAVRLANQQHSVRELTSALEIEQRASIINQFRQGIFRVLISTNVTARGKLVQTETIILFHSNLIVFQFHSELQALISLGIMSIILSFRMSSLNKKRNT